VFTGREAEQLDQGDDRGEPGGAGRKPTVGLASGSLPHDRGGAQQRDEREQRLQRERHRYRVSRSVDPHDEGSYRAMRGVETGPWSGTSSAQ